LQRLVRVNLCVHQLGGFGATFSNSGRGTDSRKNKGEH
jgi:hypothetical protein